MSKVVPVFDLPTLPTPRDGVEQQGLSFHDCSDGHVVSQVSKSSSEDPPTPRERQKTKTVVQRTVLETIEQRSLLHQSATVAETLPDACQDKELSDVLKEIEAKKPTGFSFVAKIACIAPWRQGAVLGLKDGSVTSIRWAGLMERAEMQGIMHSGEVTCLVVTQDGKLALSGSWDKTVRVWHLDTRRDLATLSGHTQSVTSLCVTLDGKFAISGSADNSLRVWHLDGFKEWATLCGHAHIVKTLAVSQDSKNVASASVDGVVKVWSLEERRMLCTLEGHSDFVTCLSFTADGAQVISGSHDMTIKVWNVDVRRETAALVGHTRYIECLLLTPDGKHIVSGAGDSSIKVWETQDFKEVATLAGHLEEVRCLAATPNCLYIISGSHDKTVKVWSLEGFCEVATFLGHTDRVKSVAVSIDGNLVLSQSANEVLIWVLEERLNSKTLDGNTWDVTCMTATRDGRYVVTGSSKGEVKLWSLEDMREAYQFVGHSSWVTCLCSTTDSCLAVSGAVDRSVKIWDIIHLQEFFSFVGHSFTIECLCISPDNKLVISGSGDNSVKVWSLEKKEEVTTFLGHKKWLTSISVSLDGQYAFSTSVDRTVRVWHIVNKQEVAVLAGHGDLIECMVVSPDSKHILTGSGDCTVKVWSLETWSEVLSFSGHKGRVKCLAITADGGHVISGSSDSSIKVWCMLEKRELTTLLGHTQSVKSVEITPNGQFVVSAAEDVTLRVWNLEEGKEVVTLRGYANPLYCFALTTDAAEIILGSADHSIVCVNINKETRRKAMKSVAASSVLTPHNIAQLKTGKIVAKPVFQACISPHYFNSLHISAYFNHSLALGAYIRGETPIIRGVYGSPLTVALRRNTSKCIDAILDTMAMMAQTDAACVSFSAITDDIPALLARNSPFLVPFFHQLLIEPSQTNLPQFITPLQKLPSTRFFPIRLIHLRDFAYLESEELPSDETQLVEFGVSLIRWNFEPGSRDSLRFLNALADCRNKKVLTTDFAATLIRTKWRYFFPLTLTLTLMYLALIVNMILILFSYWRRDVFGYIFLGQNCVMLLYEVGEMIGFGRNYMRNPWNIVDLLRGVLSLVWTWLLLRSTDLKYLRLIVAGLCFLRGFSYFRSFTSTRIFVYMTIQVVREIYSFLGILAYSVFAFGILASVMNEDDSALTSWTIAFNVLIGQSDTSNFGFVQWLVFMAANVANVVIMLNLLISILSEAYDKTQMSLLENDLHMMLGLIIEYESLLFWRRETGRSAVMVKCQAADSTLAGDDWVGRINRIMRSVKDENKVIDKKLKEMGVQLQNVEKNIRSDLRLVLSKAASTEVRPDPFLRPRISTPESSRTSSSDSSSSGESDSEEEGRDSVSIPMIHFADLARRVSANPLLTSTSFRRCSSNIGSPLTGMISPDANSPRNQRRASTRMVIPAIAQASSKNHSTDKESLTEKMKTLQRDVDKRITTVEERVSSMKTKLDEILLVLQSRG